MSESFSPHPLASPAGAASTPRTSLLRSSPISYASPFDKGETLPAALKFDETAWDFLRRVRAARVRTCLTAIDSLVSSFHLCGYLYVCWRMYAPLCLRAAACGRWFVSGCDPRRFGHAWQRKVTGALQNEIHRCGYIQLMPVRGCCSLL